MIKFSNTRKEISRLLLYIFVGGSAAIVDWTIFWFLALYLKFNVFISLLIAFCIASYINYLLGISFLFESGSRHTKRDEILMLYLVSFLGLMISIAIIFFAKNYTNMNLLLVKILGSGITFSWNYMLRAFFVFKFRN